MSHDITPASNPEDLEMDISSPSVLMFHAHPLTFHAHLLHSKEEIIQVCQGNATLTTAQKQPRLFIKLIAMNKYHYQFKTIMPQITNRRNQRVFFF